MSFDHDPTSPFTSAPGWTYATEPAVEQLGRDLCAPGAVAWKRVGVFYRRASTVQTARVDIRLVTEDNET